MLLHAAPLGHHLWWGARCFSSALTKLATLSVFGIWTFIYPRLGQAWQSESSARNFLSVSYAEYTAVTDPKTYAIWSSSYGICLYRNLPTTTSCTAVKQQRGPSEGSRTPTVMHLDSRLGYLVWRSEFSSHENTWRKFKCIFLSERSHPVSLWLYDR